MAVQRRLLSSLSAASAALALITIVVTGLARAQVATQPADAFRQIVPGLLARTIYTAESSGPHRVEIWDIVVGPGMKSEATTFPGGAVLEVRGGHGSITIDDKRQELPLGSTLPVDDGHKFALENADKEAALSLRVVVISSQQR